MATIIQGSSVFTVIVVWPCTPENQQQLVEQLVEVADVHSKRPGFVSCSIHKSLDGAKLAEYIQWKDRASFEAMAQSPEGKAHIESASAVTDAGIYEVAYVKEVSWAKASTTFLVHCTTDSNEA